MNEATDTADALAEGTIIDLADVARKSLGRVWVECEIVAQGNRIFLEYLDVHGEAPDALTTFEPCPLIATAPEKLSAVGCDRCGRILTMVEEDPFQFCPWCGRRAQ